MLIKEIRRKFLIKRVLCRRILEIKTNAEPFYGRGMATLGRICGQGNRFTVELIFGSSPATNLAGVEEIQAVVVRN
jgi:hypothetical protein